MTEQTYLTAEGAEKMKFELESLKGPARIELAQRLRSAISMGDLSENADYHKAKEDQAFLEGRILELEHTLRNATIIEMKVNGYDRVDVGATVTIQEEDDPPETYLVLGAKEADPQNGRISNESPIGRALMGKRAGERVEISTPGGTIQMRIIRVE